MKGKICVITGANAGLGYETALNLAFNGATVFLVCRSIEKGEQARRAIVELTGNSKVHIEIANLASQHQIRDLGTRLKLNNHVIDVLINNAGLVRSQWSLTEDQIETVFAVNHLAPFLLTQQLLPLLIKSSEARVINVSSNNHFKARMNFDDLFHQKSYHGLEAYGQSKLANVLFTYELDRRLKQATYHQITTNVVDPGLNNTDIGNKKVNWLYQLVWNFRKKQGMEPREGAKTQIHLAVSPELRGISGTYWKRSKAVPSADASYREDHAKHLWKLSLEMCKLDSFFP